MADVDVGRLRASLELDTDKFEQGVNRTEKKLDRLASTFQKSQQNINGSLIRLSGNVTKSTDLISKKLNAQTQAVRNMSTNVQHSITVLSRQVANQTKSINKNVDSVSKATVKSSRATVNAISNMQLAIVTELRRISAQFVALKQVSNQDFATGIKVLANTTKNSSLQITRDLKAIQKQAGLTNASLKQSTVVSTPQVKHAPTTTPLGDSGGILGSVSSMTSGLGQAFELVSQMTFKAFLLEQAFRQVSDILGTMVQPAMRFISTMETLRLGYAGIISSTMTQDGQAIPYEQSLKISEALLQKMQDEALKTSLTMEELGTALQASMAMGLNAGMNLNQVLDMTVVAAQAVKTFGLSNQQVIQEIRGLISGEAIRPGVDQLATVLGYTTATVNKLREEGKLYEDMMERMSGFRATSEEFQNSWAGLVSNLQDGISRVAGQAGQAMFDTSKEALRNFQELFFTVRKFTEMGEDGQEKSFFKIELNERTVELLRTLYNIFANLIKIFSTIGSVLGSILLPLLQSFLDSLEFMTSLTVLAHTALMPFIEGFKVLGDILYESWERFKALVSPIFESAEAITFFTGVLGALALVLLTLKAPLIGIVGLIGGISLAFKAIQTPISDFGNWFSNKIDALIYRWQAFIEGFGNEELQQKLLFRAESADALAEQYFETAKKSFTDSINNTVKGVEQISDDIFKGLASKYTAGKSSTGDKKAKEAYKALQSELKLSLQSLKEQQRQLDSVYKNDLVSTQDYIEQTLALQSLQLEKQIENLKKRKEVAQSLGKTDDVTRFDNEITLLEEKKTIAVAEATRNLITEYQKLDERLDGIKNQFEKIVGVSEEAFNTNLAKELGADYTRVSKELETANNRLAQATESKNEKEIEFWENQRKLLNETTQRLNTIISLRKLERDVLQSSSQITKIDLEIQEQFLDKKAQVTRLAYTEADAEGALFDLRKERMDEYIEQYTDVIAYYLKMSQIAEREGDLSVANSFKSQALQAKEALLELTNAVPPFQRVIKEKFIGSLSEMFQSMLWQEKTAKEALEDFAKSIMQTWSQKIFDRVATDLTNALFQGVLPDSEKVGDRKAEIDAIVESKVNVNMTAFQENITNASMQVQQNLTGGLIPTIQQLNTVMGQLITNATGKLAESTGSTLGGLFGGSDNETSDTPTKFKFDSLFGLDYGLGSDTPEIESTTENLGKFSSSLLDGTMDFKALRNSVDSSTTATDTNKEAINSNVFALGTMVASLLGTSGTLGKFGIILQHVMMAMQIAKTAGILGFASGGYVQGAGTSTSDSIPARLSDGEYVLRASAVKQLGVGFLDRLNSVGGNFKRSSRLPKFAFAEGGYVAAEAQQNTQTTPRFEGVSTSPNVVMQMTFQSLDPEANMKLMEAQYPTIRSRLIRDLQGNSSVRTAVKGASR